MVVIACIWLIWDLTYVVQVVNTPMLPTKFLYLKNLIIYITSGTSFSPSYDYFSLVSFLDASPFLETLILDVRHYSFTPSYKDATVWTLSRIHWLVFVTLGISGTYAAEISFWRFLRFEALAGTEPLLPQVCEDKRFQLCEEPGWADMLFSQERGVTQLSHIGHPCGY